MDFAKFDKQLEHEEERNEKMDLKTFKNKVISLSWVNAFKSMIRTRCYSWDNPELDVIEGYRFISFIFLQISSTMVYLNPAAKATPWSVLDMKQKIFFTIVVSSNQMTDLFIAISGFLGAYKCIQIYEANGGKLSFSDALKLYLRKYLRIAPMLYIVFFFGWACGARL